jgi:hypothetical protein
MKPAVRERILRSVLSLFATLVGWVLGFLSYIAYMLIDGDMTDLPSMFFMPGFFIVLGWLFIFHPLISWLPAEHRLFAPRVFPFVGTALAMVAFLLMVASWAKGFWRMPVLHLYAAVAGGVAAFLYSWANQALLWKERTT